MPAPWDSNRWAQNEDGSYSRVRGQSAVLVKGGYADMTKAELGDELEKRGLAKSGSKDELIERLEEDDAV